MIHQKDQLKNTILEMFLPSQIKKYDIETNYDIVFKRYMEAIDNHNVDEARNRTINFFLNLPSYFKLFLNEKITKENIVKNGYEMIYHLMTILNYLKQHNIEMTPENIQKIVKMMKNNYSVQQIQQSLNKQFHIYGRSMRVMGSATVPQAFTKHALTSQKKKKRNSNSRCSKSSCEITIRTWSPSICTKTRFSSTNTI